MVTTEPAWWAEARRLWREECRRSPGRKPKHGVYARIARVVGMTREAVMYVIKGQHRRRQVYASTKRRRQDPAHRQLEALRSKFHNAYGRVENWPEDARAMVRKRNPRR